LKTIELVFYQKFTAHIGDIEFEQIDLRVG